jgi:hypothetical protein
MHACTRNVCSVVVFAPVPEVYVTYNYVSVHAHTTSSEYTSPDSRSTIHIYTKLHIQMYTHTHTHTHTQTHTHTHKITHAHTHHHRRLTAGVLGVSRQALDTTNSSSSQASRGPYLSFAPKLTNTQRDTHSSTRTKEHIHIA